MILKIPFFNKISVDELTLELLEEGNFLILKVDTNDKNILNKKVDVNDTVKVTALNNVYDMADAIVDEFYKGKETNNYDEFKKKSDELMDKIKLL